jgi:predicted flavoprotein YhiN
MDTDVLIVGGGPTGLMLANQLGRRGNGANMWAGGKRMARIPLADMGKSSDRRIEVAGSLRSVTGFVSLALDRHQP